MYKFRITKPIEKSVSRLIDLREQLDKRGPLPRVWLGRTRRDLQAEAVAASTSMGGVPVTVDEVRRILVGEKLRDVAPESRDLVLGYRSAMAYVLRRADDPQFKWQSELVLGLHDRILGGDYSRGAGRFRESQNRVVRSDEGSMVYLPPPAEDVPSLVENMCVWTEGQREMHPATLAACVHVSIAGIHPFSDGNGRTARVLASLAMCRGGFKLPEFTSLEEWWGRHRHEYYAAFECLGGEWNPSSDISPFIETHVTAQKKQVEALSLRQETERALWTVLAEVAYETRLDARTVNAMYDAFFGRAVTNEYYRNLSDIHVNTATQDLKRLEAAGLLKASGYGRARVYGPDFRLYSLVVALAHLDTLVQMDRSLPLEKQRELVVAALAKKIHKAT